MTWAGKLDPARPRSQGSVTGAGKPEMRCDRTDHGVPCRVRSDCATAERNRRRGQGGSLTRHSVERRVAVGSVSAPALLYVGFALLALTAGCARNPPEGPALPPVEGESIAAALTEGTRLADTAQIFFDWAIS